jgi:hypothetical protein
MREASSDRSLLRASLICRKGAVDVAEEQDLITDQLRDSASLRQAIT